jgi:hypothetical protein
LEGSCDALQNGYKNDGIRLHWRINYATVLRAMFDAAIRDAAHQTLAIYNNKSSLVCPMIFPYHVVLLPRPYHVTLMLSPSLCPTLFIKWRTLGIMFDTEDPIKVINDTSTDTATRAVG